MTAEHLEIKRKYEVEPATGLPLLTDLPKVARVELALQSNLEAVYSDTDDLALAGAGITIRRWTGGSDAGWHLKLPHGGDDRSEIAEPLSEDDGTVPEALVNKVRAWARRRELRPMATLSTSRIVHRLISESGKVLAEISDDVVTAQATPQQGEVVLTTWREWEIELVGGTRKLLAAADELFARSGAAPSAWPSKLHHALGLQPGSAVNGSARLHDKSPAGDVVATYLATQIAMILANDSSVRHAQPDSVHQMRVATRRLRSALSTFRPLFDRDVTDPIREELKWLAAALGRARDSEVQRNHLLTAVVAEPDDLVLGPVGRRIRVELQSAFRTTHDELSAALDSDRYFELLGKLDLLAAGPPFTAAASHKARTLLRQRVRHACHILYALVSLGEPEVGENRDVWLHEIRKAAKRVRYAAEAARPALGKPAGALAAAAEELQEVLGEHQDSVVLRVTLRAIGVEMFADGDNPFTVGRLHALQQSRGAAADAAFVVLWSTRIAEQLREWRDR
ncbi:CHAD domain-containing protein [Nakamurella sp. UYEF19]|uniref:CYTH and CHAD domain-containing protein n=1 Tax=Nakamurella sp. UYEF19 TaxID=1756392 RepID=UPI0033937B14